MTAMELRLEALVRTNLRDVLMVDAGAIPLRALDRIFQWREFLRFGVLLAKGERWGARPGFWKLCGLVTPRHEASDELLLVDRKRCWAAIQLWQWIGERMYFFSGYLGGPGGAVQLAMHAINVQPPASLRLSQAFSRQTNHAGCGPVPAMQHQCGRNTR